MANTTGASLEPIQQRLNSTPTYHPFEANAFSDWSMEAGDMVTMVRVDEEYKSPVTVSRMVWKGNAPTMQVSSTGNEKREPVSKVSRKKYGRGSAGIRSQEGIHRNFTSEDGILHSELHVTESYLRTEFHNETDSLRSYFDMTASHMRTEFIDEVHSLRGDFEMTASHLHAEFTDEVNSLRGDFEVSVSYLHAEFTDEVNSLRSDFDLTASHLRTEFTDDVNSLRSNLDMTASHLRTEFSDDVNSVRSYVHQTASSWEMRVSGVVDANGNVTAASITAAVNSGGSNIYIEASKIHLLGQTIANTIDADYISSAIASIPVVNARSIYSSGTISTGGYVYADDFVLGVNGSGAQNNKYLHNAITELRITQSGDTYTLQKKDFNDSDWQNVDSFSRATTLTGVWGGTVAAGKTFVVTATPQGDVAGCKIYGSIVPDSSDPVEYTTSGNNHYVAQDHIIFTEDDNGDADVQILKKEVKISADLAYSDGYTTGYEEGAASGGTTTLTNTWNAGHIIVTASPQQETWDRWLSSGTATWNGTTVSIPVNALWGNSQQYSESTGWSASTDVSGKLQSKTFTSNGTKTPDSGYIGFSSVSVNVAGADADARFGASSGQYFIGAYDNVSGNLISGSNHTYKLGTSGTKVQIQDTEGSKYSSTPELTLAIDSGTLDTSTGSRTLTVTASGNDTTATLDITDYSAGKSAVTVSSILKGTVTYTASSKTLVVPITATASNNASKTSNVTVSAIDAYNAGWSAYYSKKWYPSTGTGTYMSVYWPSSTADSAADSEERQYKIENKDDNTVYLRYNGSTYAQLAHNKYYAGKAAVTLNNPAWSTTTNPGTSNTVTVSTSGRTNSSGTADNLSKATTLVLTQGSWSSNKIYVYMREGNSNGTIRAQSQVDASSIYTSGQNVVGINAPTWSTTPASGITVSGNTATFKTNAPTQSSRSLAIYLSKDSSFSSHKLYAYASHTNNTAANRIARIEIDATSEYNAGFNANHSGWIAYGKDGATSNQGYLGVGNYIHAYTNNINGVATNSGGYWWVSSAWFRYVNGAGSNHQGDLASDSYIELIYTNSDASGDVRGTGATWHVPSGGGSTSHSISQNHAYADNLATLASNLGASGSSALTNLGTFPAAGGRNYWGIKVKCGSAVKYYYVHTT